MKKIVHYIGNPLRLQVGYSAILENVVGHPDVTNRDDRIVITSKVISVDVTTGVFETLNTIYKPTNLILG